MSELSEVRILLASDQDIILAFEKSKLDRASGNAMEIEMATWSARWRPEALTHYLPQGWSFGAFHNGQLKAYALAQPFLFYRGLTQTLWVEHVSYVDKTAALQVLDVVHKWARDKHLQCVLLESEPSMQTIIQDWPVAKPKTTELIEAKSARY